MSIRTVNQPHPVRSLIRLTRMGINGLVAAATLAGYFLKAGHWPPAAIAVTVGCLLLASGCSALNQVQEAERDRLMSRTRNRPVASGAFSRQGAALVSIACFAGAALLFLIPGQLLIYGLMITAVILYNGIYTPLKTITPFTLLIGAVMGAFPPLFGWVAAGGSILDREILIIVIVFYLWQTPHFWLLVDRYRDDYRKAGFPQVFQTMPEKRYRFLIALWVAAYFISILLIPLFLPLHVTTRYVFVGMPMALALIALWRHNSKVLFPLINASIVLVILLLVVDKAIPIL